MTILMSSCNHDVFVEPLKVEPITETIDWTGGQAVFSANQSIDNVWLLAFRWVNGKGMTIGDNDMQFSFHSEGARRQIKNELCDIDMSICANGQFVVASGYNLFADTIYMNIDIAGSYETVQRGVRILPSPGFGHDDIVYSLDHWQSSEREDTMLLAQVATTGASIEFTVREKNDILASQTLQFVPNDKLLSDNIFGRQKIDVAGLSLNASGLWPEETVEKVAYTSVPKKLENSPLCFEKDIKIMLEKDMWYKVRAIVRSESFGVAYSLNAVSPIASLSDRLVDGVCCLTVPKSYTIEVEKGKMK